MMRAIAALALLAGTAAGAQALPLPQEKDPYWAIGRDTAAQHAKTARGGTRAKNVILIIGDGMGVSTITAARIFEMQQKQRAAGQPMTGEENLLSFERLPNVAHVKTYNTNAQVPDSAGTASSMNTGVKTRIGYINMPANRDKDVCADRGAWPTTLAEIAKARGLGVGVVTTTRITHATPAAVFAHVPNRNWEGADRAFPAADRTLGCTDIATQLVSFAPGGGIDVALGGGRARFLPVEAGGMRDDRVNLLDRWRQRHADGAVVLEASAFRKLDPAARGPVLGLFNDDHISFRADRDPAVEPSLPEMATFALAKLQRSHPNGFYLMIEAGRIDHAHHLTNAYRALDETVELSDTVRAVLERVDLRDTLVMVTSDHSHVFTIAGYPPRGNDILGCIKPLAGGESRSGTDAQGCSTDDRNQPMPTLGYQNGPFEVKIGGQTLHTGLPFTDRNNLRPKLYGLDSETHGGEDVTLFADGPGSQLVGGVIEQNTIFHIAARALGLPVSR